MTTDNDILARFLGRTAPEEFESEADILAYFQPGSLREMFPGDVIDEFEAGRACEMALAAWRRARGA